MNKVPSDVALLPNMEHQLELKLLLLTEADDVFQFRLDTRNNCEIKLLLPCPGIQHLRFVNKATTQESQWYTRILQHSSWRGFTLEPNEEKSIEMRARPCDVQHPAEYDGSDYSRWCVGVPPGEYLVTFQFEVGEDYFCPDSHYRYKDVMREAELAQAIVWTGRVLSNELTLIRPDRPTSIWLSHSAPRSDRQRIGN